MYINCASLTCSRRARVANAILFNSRNHGHKSDPTMDLIKRELPGAIAIKREAPIGADDVATDVGVDVNVDVNIGVDIGDAEHKLEEGANDVVCPLKGVNPPYIPPTSSTCSPPLLAPASPISTPILTQNQTLQWI